MRRFSKVIALTMIISILSSTVAFAAPNYYTSNNVTLSFKEWGMEDTVNLVGTVNEYINFDSEMELNVELFKDGYYDIEIWDEYTYKVFGRTNHDEGGIIVKGLMYKKPNGELAFYKGSLSLVDGQLFNGLFESALKKRFIRIPRNTTEIAEYGVSDWNILNGPGAPTKPLPTDNKELYGYIMHFYDYRGHSKWVDDFQAGKPEEECYQYKYDPQLVLFKFPVNENKTEIPITETAVPITSKVIIDGKVVEFDAYNINNNNYFKLRDVALSLNEEIIQEAVDVSNKNKSFSVFYMPDFNILTLNSYWGYTPVGGELNKSDGKVKTAVLNDKLLVYKDTDFITPTAYNINENNFFKLRDLMEAFDYGLAWDGQNNAIIIDTTKSYDGSPRNYDPFDFTQFIPQSTKSVEAVKPVEVIKPVEPIKPVAKEAITDADARKYGLEIVDSIKFARTNDGKVRLTLEGADLQSKHSDYHFLIKSQVRTRDEDGIQSTNYTYNKIITSDNIDYVFKDAKADNTLSMKVEINIEDSKNNLVKTYIISTDFTDTVFEYNKDYSFNEISQDITSKFGNISYKSVVR